MLPEAAVQPEYADEQASAASKDDRQDDVQAESRDVEHGKSDQKQHQPGCEPANILAPQSTELDGTVNPFIDVIYRSHTSDAKEGFQNGSYYNQEDTGAEPSRGHFIRVRVSGIPLVEDLHGANDADYRADGIHQITACVEVAFYFVGSLSNTGIAVLAV